ncbi:hypothetical protein DFH11DRAFT_1549324 [Phellopilus nigrolimitatus]|nr:hypothetical protein DFH11DRAFT_1549324 [Phellopilus nigrolimitatus]
MSEASCGLVSCAEEKDLLFAILWTKLSIIASFALLVYDYCVSFNFAADFCRGLRMLLVLTLNRELELVWGTRFGLGKLLFLLLRYFTPVVITCIAVVILNPGTSTEVSFGFDSNGSAVSSLPSLRSLRLYAMYGRTKNILIFLIVTSVSTFGTISVYLGKIITKEHGSTLFMCIPLDIPSDYRTVWIPLFVHEVILVALAIIKGFQNIRDHGTEGLMSRFTIFLVGDSMSYFFVVFAAFFSMELTWVIRGVYFMELPIGLSLVSMSIMSQRQLLKIRKRYHQHSTSQRTLRRTGLMNRDESMMFAASRSE